MYLHPFYNNNITSSCASSISGVDIDQKLIKNLPVTITWTGKTNFSDRKGPEKCRRVAQVYDQMNPQLFFEQFITLIFKPLKNIIHGIQ